VNVVIVGAVLPLLPIASMSKAKLSDLLHDSAGLIEFATDLNFRTRASKIFTDTLSDTANSREHGLGKTSKHAVIRHISKLRASQKDLMMDESSDDISTIDSRQRSASANNAVELNFLLLEEKAFSSSCTGDAAKAQGHRAAVKQAYDTYNDDELTQGFDSFSGILDHE
jgi:hypothetical protein